MEFTTTDYFKSKSGSFNHCLTIQRDTTDRMEKHGFRTGVIGQENDPKILEVVGIPESITEVVPMPNPIIMEKLIKNN